MASTRPPEWLVRAPAVAAIVVALATVASLAAILAVDVHDAWGLRERLFVERGSEYPYLFYRLYSEGHLVEWLQWAALLVAAVAFAVAGGRMSLTARSRRAWGVVTLGFACGVLALKDAGNPRHTVAEIGAGLGGQTASRIAELAVQGLVAATALLALVSAWPAVRRHTAVRRLALSAYAVYGLAAAMSATSSWWYVPAGRALLDGPLGGRMLAAPATWDPGLLPWLFMDSVVEESVELVAAGLLAVAALALLREIWARPRIEHAGSRRDGGHTPPLGTED